MAAKAPESRFSLKALLTGRCPRCRRGHIFAPFFSSRMVMMNEACESCGLRFEREAGYFLGAMYVSYTLGVLAVIPLSLGLILLANWDLIPVLLLAVAVTLVCTPTFYRYSRIIWIHLDRAFIPTETNAQEGQPRAR